MSDDDVRAAIRVIEYIMWISGVTLVFHKKRGVLDLANVMVKRSDTHKLSVRANCIRRLLTQICDLK